MDILGNINEIEIDQTHKNVGKNFKKNERNNNTHIEVVLLKKVIYTYKTICYIHQ